MTPRVETQIHAVDGDASRAIRDPNIRPSPHLSLSSQPPLNLFGLPARYAALYTAGSKAGNLATVQAEFKTVSHPDNPHRVVPHGSASGAREPTPWETDRTLSHLAFAISTLLNLLLCLEPRLEPLPPSAKPRLITIDPTQVIDAANADKKFKVFLEDPTMPKAKKVKALSDFCDGAKFAPITKSFLVVVAENGRLDQNQKIYDALEEYTLAAAGQKKATVTSAQPLTPEQLKDLTAARGHVDAGEDLKIETKVDPKLVGGFTVAMGEDFFDLSLMSRIRAMEQELAKPV